ncbi:SurA N-terminal domain-containing protein [Alkalibacter rhizosphaerae]|uniref:SurA N-terminal domain-containing protein n=1 Tax=Alkalibacter rhizosphaerae TaxID=2815577 RepID=A0A975AHF4_9FIRM|nr:SurA N-terminal domain-containing protein [Alkalibacter rhizosphaerae]QSX07435.1 SurA N-terminal domain-containing protein [Alkalibacter rhizosphaerae]
MNRKRYLTLLLIIAFLVTVAGCSLIQVDTEKDMERIVVEMGDEEIAKKEYNKYLTYHTLIYEVNGYTMPEGDSLKTMKEDLLDTMVEINILRKQAEELDLEVDLEGLSEEADELLTTFLEGLGEDKYLRILEDNYMTREEFESFFRKYMEDVKYANAAIANFTETLREDASAELDKVIMTVDGQTIKKEELYYQLSMVEFEYYLGTGSGLPGDSESLGFIYEEIQNKIAETRLMAAAAEKEGMTASDEEIEEMSKEMKANFSTYFNEETLETYLADYYLTTATYDAMLEEDAKRAVLIEKYQKSLETGLTVTSDEIKEYYDEHKSSYDTDTVSAKHILTESEDHANALLETITDVASFETAFELAKEDEEVKEAADLGAFSFGQMVTEFSAQAFAMDPGEVSTVPVKTEFGYHIIYVYDQHTAEIPTLEEKTSEIREGLVAAKAMELYTEKMTKAKEEAEIEKEEIQDPFEVHMDQLLEQYKVTTYPSRL